uniref:Protein m28 n=1 Tax=Mastomys natalensis cytomegalovirus 2 TaxID=2973540 RepID=A0A9Y1N678_9BETA|nr:protein m28 [Mastomys natalensis cytomegalovirus 2]WEG69170.1 protein m28 [Mastomys natalensis cytomegalovirus 2]WEG69309.1 protein m28 [Mastomys natalensis cytomegalovirus 2]WEG69447.1 protein m28 [Mastomys natalensis cytomegalovirus 2]WEG69585.1 protein m28 [Mastomys natalensis cytomegalovirus 2]
MSSDATPDDLDEVFVRDTPVTFYEGVKTVEGATSATETSRKRDNAGGEIITGVARQILVDDDRDTIAANVMARNELLSCARLTNRTSFSDVEQFVRQNKGRRFGLDHELEVHLVIGDKEFIDPSFDVGKLLQYVCSARSYRMTVIGKILFGSGEHGALTAVYTAGDRCYVHSADTNLLYIVSERGLTDLLVKQGHRNIYEMFDKSVAESDDSGIPLSMLSLAMITDADRLEKIVRDRAGMSTYRFPRTKYNPCIMGGYFMVGDENGLGLGKYFPDLVFTCLREAGYRVMGRTEHELIVVYNRDLEIFVLLEHGVVLKIANTVQGFLRDRLRYGMHKYRRCFKPTGDNGSYVCVGQALAFPCSVEYVVPGGSDFRKWLDSDEGHPITEERTPVLNVEYV